MSEEKTAEQIEREARARAEVDRYIDLATNQLAIGVKRVIENLGIPATKNLTCVAAITLVKIACRMVKQQDVEIEKFAAILETSLGKEFAGANEVASVVGQEMLLVNPAILPPGAFGT